MSSKMRNKKKSFKARFSTTLHDLADRLFSTPSHVGSIEVKASVPEYELSEPSRINPRFTRGLYRNTLKEYKLSAHLTKPIIDANVSFIDLPEVRADVEETKDILEGLMKFIPFSDVHRTALRDGKCLVWPQWNVKLDRIEFVVIPPETIQSTIVEPITKRVTGYVFQERVTYYKDIDNAVNKAKTTATITTMVTSERVNIQMESDDGDKINRTQRNPFGFLPIVPFVNDNDPWEHNGHSDLEVIEPMLKFYHDMTIEAGSAQKRDGHPKAKVKTSNVKTWLENNFGEGTYDAVLAGKAKISMQDRDLFLLSSSEEDNEDIQYIELNKTTGDYAKLSEIVFTNIVEGSQTPEIIFGANLGTSLASVKEQRPVWIKKVQKLQKKFSVSWEEVFKIALRIQGFVNFSDYDETIQLVWPIPDFSSYKEKADTFNALTNALVKQKNARLMSDKEIHATMLDKVEGIIIDHNFENHGNDVEKTSELIIKRIASEHEARMERMNERTLEDDTEIDDPVVDDPEDKEDDNE